MFQTIINKINPTIENFEKELLRNKFDSKNAEDFKKSKKINI